MSYKSFSERCYQVLRTVPSGKVTTYKDIAQALGSKSYRAVGNAMHKNPYAPQVPCHRVVASDGSIGGFAFGLARKKQLLRREGITICAEKIRDFETVRMKLRRLASRHA